MAEAEAQNHVLVVPFPAPSHMLPLLDLAYFLSARFGFAVTVVVTPKNLPCLSPLLSRAPAVSPLVLPFPGDSDLPPGVEDAQGLRFPHVNTLLRALGGLHGPILRWAEEAAAHLPVSAVLSDFFLGWTHRLADDLGVPRLVFSPSGAAALAVQHSLWRRLPQRTNFDDAEELIPFPSVPRSPLYPWRQLPTLFKVFEQGDPLSEFVRAGFLGNINSWAFVINTFSELEKPYLDHLRDDLGHERVWAVGPLSLIGGGATTERDPAAEELFAWLDGCIEASVVYVAFGSLAVLPPAQVAALAAGLEKSGARFLWAAKGVEKTSIPEGFEERVAGRGRVLRSWVPQTAILAHPAVGAFLSHCGWNSVLEAVAAGVPVLTWPISADQYTNARLLREELGMGTVAYEGGEPAPDPTELARVVMQSVSEVGRARKKKAKDASRAMAAAVQEDSGSSYMNLAALKEELLRCTSLKAI